MATPIARRSSKKPGFGKKVKGRKRASTSAARKRSSKQILRPSIKINDKWTHLYTSKFQSLWDSLYLSIIPTQMIKISSSHSPQSSSKNAFRLSKLKKRPSTNDFFTLFDSICQSMQFGIINMAHKYDRIKQKDSDVLCFYFTLKFETCHRNTYMLHLKYMRDEILAKKSKPGDFMELGTEIRTTKTQISCDLQYAEFNNIINKKQMSTSLTPDVLAVVFEYVRPNEWLSLYSSKITDDDDNFDSLDVDKFDKKYFDRSNIEWVGNYFGLASRYFVKLIRVLMSFLEHPEVLKYIKKEKDYNKQWTEWQDAQQELYLDQLLLLNK